MRLSPLKAAARRAGGVGLPALPARLALLLALALTLGALSMSKLHEASSTAAAIEAVALWGADHLAGSQALGARQPITQVHLAGSQEEQQPGEQAGHRGEEELAAQPPGACFKRFPWVQPALDVFYDVAWRAANASTQSTEEALAALRGVMWGKYHPGMDEVVLQYSQETGRVEMEVVEVSPPNQPHKKAGMLGVLADAVRAHSAELAALLQGRQLRLAVQTEDFGVVWRGQNWKLPAFSMCTDNEHSDIPVPDFTYGCYPEARYANSSWPAISELLQHKSGMLGWHERHTELFHRSNWAVGVRKSLMPLLQSYANGSAGVSDVEAFGAELDIGDTGFVQVNAGQAQRKHDAFVWLDGQCDYKYLIHTAGFSYSGGLKYKLACGAIVFKFDSPYIEFFEPALRDDFHVVRLPAGKDGINVSHFQAFTAPRIKEVVNRTRERLDAPPIARQGQAFVQQQLTVEALSCYWLGALERYAEIYFLPQTPAQQQAQQQAGSSGSGGGGGAEDSSGQGGSGGSKDAAVGGGDASGGAAAAEKPAAAEADRGGGQGAG